MNRLIYRIGTVLVSMLLVVSAAIAQSDVRIGKKNYLSSCGSPNNGAVYFITNAAADGECLSTGAPGLYKAACQCGWDGATYAWGALAGGGAPDLSAYALLAGDTDGQAIQGVAGANQPRLLMDGGNIHLFGDGATPPELDLSSTDITLTGNVFLYSPDENTDIDVFDGGVAIATPGNISLDGNSGGMVNLGANDGVDLVASIQVGPNGILLSTRPVPVAANSTGTAGEVRIGASFIYYCTATDTWVRVAMATW